MSKIKIMHSEFNRKKNTCSMLVATPLPPNVMINSPPSIACCEAELSYIIIPGTLDSISRM